MKYLRIFKNRRIWFLFLIIVVVGGFFIYRINKNKIGGNSYVMGAVEKGSIITTVSGTGQIETSDQVDVKPNVAADIVAINIKAGQKVKAGDIIAKLDDSDLKDKVKQAKNSLTSAQANLSLKLAGATAQEIKLAENSVSSAKLNYDQAVINVADTEENNKQSLAKAEMQVNNSQINLESAQRNYDNALVNSEISGQNDDSNLTKVYNDGRSTIESTQISIRSAIVAIDDILGENNYSNNDHPYLYLLGARDSQSMISAKNSYQAARTSYLKLEASNKAAASAGWTEELIVAQLAATKETAGLAKTMASDAYNVLINTVVASGLSQSTIDGYKQTASSQENSLLNAINSLTQNQKAISDSKLDVSSSGISSSASVSNAKSSLDTAKNNLETAKNSLNQTISDNKKSLEAAKNELAAKKISYENAKIQLEQKTAAPREVDLASARVQVAQAKQDYEDALENLADAEVKSPIDGVVAKVNQKVGYAASASDSNSSNSIATIITDQQLAVISLNEVDIAKVKTGQKAMLTFTAIEDLELTGQVVEIDSLGTDTQGVVSYEVKINLDSQDERVKSQMSVSAEIITESSTDVLVIDSNAIKTDNDNLSYVEVFENKKLTSGDSFNTTETPTKKYIETGVTNDTQTEITGGLSEGDIIIVQTSSISSGENQTSAKTSTSQRSGLQMMGGAMNMGAGGPPSR